jgi:hypothetical protein
VPALRGCGCFNREHSIWVHLGSNSSWYPKRFSNNCGPQ